MPTISRAFILRMLAIASLVLWPPSLQSQSINAPQAARQSAERDGWSLVPGLKVVERFDDNPFFLSDVGLTRMDVLSPASLASGRYTNMGGARDYITSMRGGLAATGPAFFGRKLTLGADARYEYYQKNAKRRNFLYDLRAIQSLGHGTHVGVRAAIIPSYFFRNYLADAVDLNLNGVIEPNERIYGPGTYSDKEFSGELRQRLVKSTDDHPFGAEVTLKGGHKTRIYEQPFQTRGYRGPFVGAGGVLDLGSNVVLEGDYRRLNLKSTPGTSVVLLNEPDFNQDFNANGRLTDLRVRSVQMVDFSRVEQDMAARFRIRSSDAVQTTLSYGLRLRNYQSKQPYDIYNNTRKDKRDRYGIDLAYHFSPGRSVHIGANGEIQKLTNTLRPTVLLDGVTDYTRKAFYVSWSHQR